MTSRFALRLLLSCGLSLLLLGLLLHGFSGSAEEAARPRLIAVLAETSLICVGLYVLTSLSQAFFRALRYQLILRHSSGGAAVPGMGRMLIVTLSRNMFVDMLPARLGELGYIAMLNRGFKVSAETCLSSLAVSFLFDLIALAVLLLGIMGWQLATADFQPWLIGVALMILAVSAAGLFFLFPLLRWFSTKLAPLRARPWAAKLVRLTEDTAAALDQARRAGIAGQVLVLSLAVRMFKYLGLYLLFFGVASASFPEMNKELSAVLVALVSAEAGSALPVPTFMSFGTYEAGGALALTALGAAKAASVLVMLALHIWSQAVDYTLGIIAMSLFIFLVGRQNPAQAPQRKKWLLPLAACLFCAGLAVFALQVRSVSKMGSFRPPKSGEPIPAAEAELAAEPILAKLRGFVIWSSNRFGSHDLIMLTLPDRKLSRLTSDPHTDYFPRISPDGSKVVFARSQEPWVSQRNKYPWDVWLLDLHSGASRLLAKNGNTPTWSADGSKVYFLRQANQFVEYVLATGKETVVFETGKNLPLPAATHLETPVWSEARQSLAVTMRKNGPVYTWLIGPDRTVRELNEGCELNWSPDSSFLYQVGHSKGRRNVFYKINPDTLEPTLWFDAPGEYSHEYFPKISKTGDVLVYGASTGGHEHDTADYEIFLWPIGSPMSSTARLSFHTGNDNWPDVFLY
jgi:Tol biopolymer transport system component